MISVLAGDCRARLAALPAGSMHLCVTSPPFYSLRAYGTEPQVWGGSEGCEHEWGEVLKPAADGSRSLAGNPAFGNGWSDQSATLKAHLSATCSRCGAWRGELGLEPSVELYLAHLLEVFRAVRRVLRSDGTCWVNLGDSYSTTPTGSLGNSFSARSEGQRSNQEARNRHRAPGLPPGSLLQIPARFALAMQQPWEEPARIKRIEDRAWLAAIIDGEGTISIRRCAGRSNGTGEPCNDTFTAFISISNTDTALLERCAEIVGRGKVRVKNPPFTDPRGISSRFTGYGWRIDSILVGEVLKDIYPYLITKRRQALLAYNLQLSNERGRSLRGNGPLPASEVEKRALLKDLINRCNQREEVVLPNWLIEPKRIVEPGWLLRSAIVLAKAGPMPESVQGVRHERCRRKVRQVRGAKTQSFATGSGRGDGDNPGGGLDQAPWAEYEDCPGCPRCEGTDGLVLRWGSGRPTSSYEYLFLFAKTSRYFYNSEAVRLPNAPPNGNGGRQSAARQGDPERYAGLYGGTKRYQQDEGHHSGLAAARVGLNTEGANARNVLKWQPAPLSDAHYAPFPPFIPDFAIRAGTASQVCGACGAPYAPVVERGSADQAMRDAMAGSHIPGSAPDRFQTGNTAHRSNGWAGGGYVPDTKVLAHRPTCECCRTCDTLGLSPSERRTAHAAAEAADGTGVAASPGIQSEEVARGPDLPGEASGTAEEVPEAVRAVRSGVPGQVGHLAFLQPNLLFQVDVGDGAGEPFQPDGDEPLSGEVYRWGQDADGSPARDGGASGQETGDLGARPPHQRGPERQPAGEPGRSDEREACQGAHHPPPHRLEPYPTAPSHVLDPFGGSGTTALAADRLGRDCTLIDLQPDYCGIAARRVKEDAGLFAELTVDAASNGHQPALELEDA